MKLWTGTASPQSPPLAQCAVIRGKPPTPSFSLARERVGADVQCSSFSEEGPKDWFLSHLLLSADSPCTLQLPGGCGGRDDRQHDLLVPQSTCGSADRQPYSSGASPWGNESGSCLQRSAFSGGCLTDWLLSPPSEL